MVVGQIMDFSINKVKKGEKPHKMSMWVDIESGKPFEVEVSFFLSCHHVHGRLQPHGPLQLHGQAKPKKWVER